MDEYFETARFFDLAIADIGGLVPKVKGGRRSIRVLDFGCGTGRLAGDLSKIGYDAYGCDIIAAPEGRDPDHFRQIQRAPYRLPFDDNSFDVIISTSVLEHARNPEEYFPEIHRLLKVGGVSMHLLPGKWYLPYEPHILVPLANWFYPNCPTWWFAMWTLMGQRAGSEKGMTWREATRSYRKYYDTGLFYMTTAQYQMHSRRVFGNYEWPMEFYIAHAHGGLARLFRKLPFRKLWGWVSREFRMGLLVQRKTNGA